MEEPQLLKPNPQPDNPAEPAGKRPKNRLSKREIGLIVFVIAAIIGVGAYAWWTGNKKEAAINSFAECVAAGNPVMESYPEQCAANGRTWSNPDQQAQTAPDEEPPQKGELSIPELGVKFELTEALEGLYYYINPENPSAAYFSLEEFRGSDCAADRTSLAAIAKLTEEEASGGDPLYGDIRSSAKEIGGAYYHASGAQAGCGEDQTAQTKAGAVRTELLRILPSSLQAL